MTDQLTAAIAEVKRVDEVHGRWPESGPSRLHRDINVVLNAVASGDLIPATDAKLAVADALRSAADEIRGSNLGLSVDDVADDVLALAPADALAEVQGMRADIATLRECAKLEMERAEAAEAKLAALMRAMDDLWGWVENWHPDFMSDPDFDKSKYTAALAAAKGVA